jgi:2-dehydropantoate 2-reductase
MSDTRRYVIVGAGAVGCVVGAFLRSTGFRVLFLARPPVAAAIRAGLTVALDGTEVRISAPAATEPREIEPEQNDILLLTTKTQSTAAVVRDLSAVYDRAATVVCLQNGVVNEQIAGERFDRVYAGLVLLTAVQLKPSVVLLTQGKTLAVGGYPGGLDNRVNAIRDDLERAGFDAVASGYVMAMKWGKLISNLNNAFHAITGYWLERSMADPESRRLMLDIREEGLRVLEAAGIAVEPPAGEPSPIRILKMTEDLRRPPKGTIAEADALPEDRRAYPSMWQDLYHGRQTNEGDFLNGEIVRLGARLGIPTPYNRTLLEIIDRMSREGLKPGLYTPAELRSVIESSR